MVSSEYTWHVSRVIKRVLKLVNFEVQKVQKPELFDLAATFPRLRGDQGPLGHVSHPGANFTTKETPGATCVALKRGHFALYQLSFLVKFVLPCL